jgi:hypothetical protein
MKNVPDFFHFTAVRFCSKTTRGFSAHNNTCVFSLPGSLREPRSTAAGVYYHLGGHTRHARLYE